MDPEIGKHVWIKRPDNLYMKGYMLDDGKWYRGISFTRNDPEVNFLVNEWTDIKPNNTQLYTPILSAFQHYYDISTEEVPYPDNVPNEYL